VVHLEIAFLLIR